MDDKPKKKRINSRDKGARAERAFAKVLSLAGFPAKRGQQHSGGADSPDVICASLPHIHFELKHVLQHNQLWDWVAQAHRDAGDQKLPVVVHRKNARPWLVTLAVADFIALVAEIEEGIVVDLATGYSPAKRRAEVLARLGVSAEAEGDDE